MIRGTSPSGVEGQKVTALMPRYERDFCLLLQKRVFSVYGLCFLTF